MCAILKQQLCLHYNVNYVYIMPPHGMLCFEKVSFVHFCSFQNRNEGFKIVLPGTYYFKCPYQMVIWYGSSNPASILIAGQFKVVTVVSNKTQK